jgi:hypothetical protein
MIVSFIAKVPSPNTTVLPSVSVANFFSMSAADVPPPIETHVVVPVGHEGPEDPPQPTAIVPATTKIVLRMGAPHCSGRATP